ncbi:MAG: DJ-1/PfpI family protein [Tissierellia bacterium]|nr:DJ-1/PfpI family protein [Tissierellia bacterium]
MKKIIVFLADGFEEIEALTVVDYLRRADIKVDTVSIKDDLEVIGAHDIKVISDKKITEINKDEYDGLYIPGGLPGATNLRDDKRVVQMAKEFNDSKKIVAAICAGPIVLDKARVLEDKKATSFPSFKEKLENLKEYEDDKIVVVDDNVITARGAAVAVYMALTLIEKLCGEDKKEELKPGIQQDNVEKYFSIKY